jgi:hypothetical protein
MHDLGRILQRLQLQSLQQTMPHASAYNANNGAVTLLRETFEVNENYVTETEFLSVFLVVVVLGAV